MEIDIEGGKELIPSLLSSLYIEDNLYKKINMVNILLNGLDDDIKKRVNTNNFKKIIEIYMDNTNFIRRLKLYCILLENTETAMEYLGTDYLTHEEFIFDKDFEILVNILNQRINNFVGNLLKIYSEGEKITL